ncbi:MAG: molybdate ABC transporter substrate-binding protein [Methanosarcinaceae archaeon]
MKKAAMILISIMFYSAVTSGCIGEMPKQVTTIGETPVGITSSTTEKPQSLMVYCGAGMREPMDEIGLLFKEKYGVSVDCNYLGSGHLLNQIELAQVGDVYQPGAMYYLDIARNKSLIGYEKIVAYHVPVIAVPKGNPANITCLADLGKPGVKLAMGDPEACAIGKVGTNILEKNGIKDAVEKNTIARGATVNALIVYVSTVDVDAAITWKESVLLAPDKTDIVWIPDNENIIKTIPIGVLAFSENKESARSFVDFVTSDEGKAIYKKYGFVPYPNESLRVGI